MQALDYLALTSDLQFTRLSDEPLERYKNIADISSPYNQGDLIFSVSWYPRLELGHNPEVYGELGFDPKAYETNREIFFALVEKFIAIVCSQISSMDKTKVMQFKASFELNDLISDQANIIFTSPEHFDFGHLNKSGFLTWCWDQACDQFTSDGLICEGEIITKVNDEVIDVDGWVSKMVKPYKSESRIILSD